jgi:hypothetical protein
MSCLPFQTCLQQLVLLLHKDANLSALVFVQNQKIMLLERSMAAGWVTAIFMWSEIFCSRMRQNGMKFGRD